MMLSGLLLFIGMAVVVLGGFFGVCCLVIREGWMDGSDMPDGGQRP